MKFFAMGGLLLVVSCAPQPEPLAVVTRSKSTGSAARVAAFCVAKNGQRVGDGQCWALANEAFNSAGVKRPTSDLRVWGRKIQVSSESFKAGDIVEFESARFIDGTITGTHHTAVVVQAGTAESLPIAEQNWCGRKTVGIRRMNLKGLLTGNVKIYRPQ